MFIYMLQFILFYLVLILLSGLIVNGFFAITRGRWELNPDGTKYWTGKILKGYHKWLQRHTVEHIPYGNDEWLKIYFQLKSYFQEKDILTVFENGMVVKKMDELRTTTFFAFALSKGIKVNLKTAPGENREQNIIIAAYKTVNKYTLPELLRDPLGECITCMASVFGTLLWVFWLFLANHINSFYPTPVLTVFLGIGFGFKILLWILFCVILAYINELILNINNSLKK